MSSVDEERGLPFTAMIARAREFFTLEGAERAARAHSPSRLARVHAYFEAAERRLSAGRRIAAAVAASRLIREAIVCYLHASRAGGEGDDNPDSALPWDDLARVMPRLPPDPTRPDAEPTDDARVRAALAARDILFFDRLSSEDAERTRWALERAAALLRAGGEVPRLSRVRQARWERALVAAVALAFGVTTTVRARRASWNVALHKPVTASSVKAVPAHEQSIVDGNLGWSYGVLTDTEANPTVTIDLVDVYRIERVLVHNRRDGQFDDCLPLVVETSTDGSHFREVDRRDRHFDAEPPWVVFAGGEPGRYVRLRVARRSYLALSEVEVFGTKM